VTPLKMDRLDASIDKIVPAGAKLERIVAGFKWIEGPVWADGRLFFAEIPSNSIRTWTPGKGVSIFLQPSGYQGHCALRRPRVGIEWNDAGRARTPDGGRPCAARRLPV
jgi:gluconolactonase